ncbi:ABC transporter ATP-binding protein [Povalibacter sp.]|uniref:ABC transporter ATP-binding protein n=1 Tax=Povalibacter sp. TaxID=1962978 RepID=UPI002F4241EC
MSESSDQEVLRLADLRKSYNVGEPTQIEILHGIDLTLRRRDFAALIGPSGSGKSTLLNLIGLLDQPASGELLVLGQATSGLEDSRRTQLRAHTIGFVFQFHHLIEAFTALENVLMPWMVTNGKPDKRMLDWGRSLLDAVGLANSEGKKPRELSGGQQQRVAVARALVTRPALLLADEPTGNLDTRTAEGVFKLFRRFNEEMGCAVLLVTHDPRLAQSCDRVIELVDGRIVRDEVSKAR